MQLVFHDYVTVLRITSEPILGLVFRKYRNIRIVKNISF